MGSSGEPGLFVNDGSFLERFKQFQEQQEASKSTSKLDVQEPTGTSDSYPGSPAVKSVGIRQSSFSLKAGSLKPVVPTNGKLAFSLRQKSRLAANAIKLSEEDEDDEGDTDRHAKKLKSDKASGSPGSLLEQGFPFPPPSDLEIKKVADKLASFVAKNGRQFENVTRQKNPGDTPFKFLFDVTSPEYKYYDQRVTQEEQALLSAEAQNGLGGGSTSTTSWHRASQQLNSSQHQRTNYSIPASALYSGSNEDRGRHHREQSQDLVQSSNVPTDSVSMMEFYMKKVAQEDLRKPAKLSRDEVPPPASLLPPEKSGHHSPLPWSTEEIVPPERDPFFLSSTKALVDAPTQVGLSKKGHHMGDYIPPEELEKFLAKCNDAMARKAAKATADRAKIQADNVGHRLLSKMGWKEGEGLGSRKGGRADPVQAGAVKLNNLGVGAEQPGEVTPDDDIYEQYKKRMMLGYRFRPNPLNNPRKAYY